MAAEGAAAVWAAEEVVSTTAYAGVGAYMVSKPTMPLHATFHQIPASKDERLQRSLARSDHSLSVVGDKAYIFGGELIGGSLASNDVCSVGVDKADLSHTNYSSIAPIADVPDGPIPASRKKHAACSFNVCVAIFGGVDAQGMTVNENGAIWLFNTAKSAWESMAPKDTTANVPAPRYSSRLFNHDNNLVLYGGHDAAGLPLNDTWLFDYTAKTWTRLAESPVSTLSAVVADGVLYAIAGTDNMSSDLHYLRLPPHDKKDVQSSTAHEAWEKVVFPTNPLTPGPRPRLGAGLSHITTGHGRNYLAYFFGARQVGDATSATDEKPPPTDESADQDPLYWSDMWTYQVPSSEHKLTDLASAIKPSKIKDGVRHMLGLDSGEHSWGEVAVEPPRELPDDAGKLHPGPRGYFGYDHMSDGTSLVIWGGINAKGDKESDGWVITLG